MARKPPSVTPFDVELADLPPQARWSEWMRRVEAVIFASATPVSRSTLARVVGRDCNVDLIIDDLKEELHGRPYELVSIAGGWQYRTRTGYAAAIRASGAPTLPSADLTPHEATVLMAVAYFQPITRGELGKIFGKDVSRDTIVALRHAGMLASGPRSPTPGAPYTLVTTPEYLSVYGFNTLRDLPDIEMLEDAGLLSKHRPADDDIPQERSDDEEDFAGLDET